MVPPVQPCNFSALDVRSGEGDFVNRLIGLANQKINDNSSAKSLSLIVIPHGLLQPSC